MQMTDSDQARLGFEDDLILIKCIDIFWESGWMHVKYFSCPLC
jgi:hypothetical protein